MSTDHSKQANTPNVLLVDEHVDELNRYRQALQNNFEVHTAVDGTAALEVLKDNGDISVIVTGMQLPGVNGLELLLQVKLRYPHIVRIMLTHNDDQQTAIDAINRGEIYRFLHKPCSAEHLQTTINQGVEHFRLLQVEHDMLRHTMRGAIKSLTEVLSIVNPEASGRSMRITNLTVDLAKSVGMKNVWFLESLAMLSQLGCVILPAEVLELVYQGGELSEQQREMVEKHPAMGAEIVEQIPRLESMAHAIRYQMKNYDGSGSPVDEIQGEKIPLGARILRVVIDFERYVTSGDAEKDAYQRILSHPHRYDPGIVRCLKKVIDAHRFSDVLQLTVDELTPGMIVVEDVKTNAGIRVINRGHIVSDTLLQRLRLFSHQHVIAEPIRVIIKNDDV